jgi:hypothetical protein
MCDLVSHDSHVTATSANEYERLRTIEPLQTGRLNTARTGANSHERPLVDFLNRVHGGQRSWGEGMATILADNLTVRGG